jgi:hypothetical protein
MRPINVICLPSGYKAPCSRPCACRSVNDNVSNRKIICKHDSSQQPKQRCMHRRSRSNLPQNGVIGGSGVTDAAGEDTAGPIEGNLWGKLAVSLAS